MSTFSTKDISDLPLDDPLFDDIYERYCEFYDGRVLNPDSKSKWFNGLRRFRTDFPFAKSYCIFNGESVLGYISYFRWSEQKSNNLFIRVPLKFKSESFTNFIAQFLKERIGERSLILKSSFPLIQQSAVKAGMIEGNVIQHFKKELKDFSIPMLEEWASKIPNNVKLEIENYVSDENLEDVAFMMTTYLNDMLRPNMHETFVETAPEIKSFMEFSKKNGNSFIHLILRGEDNKPLGICLGMYSSKNPIVYEQKMTGLDKSLRGGEVGLALKAFCYLKILRELPTIKTVITDCFKENIPIVKTNRKMGFEEDFEVKEYYSKG